MKRYTRMIVVLLMLALLLSACTATGQTPTEPVSDTTPPTTATESTAAPTEEPTNAPTEVPTEPTQAPTEAPTEPAPTQCPEEILKVEALNYASARKGYKPFIYEGGFLNYPGAIDYSQLQENHLYVYDEEKRQVYSIGGPVFHFMVVANHRQIYTNTVDYIYFVLENEPTKVYRSDYTGQNRELMYESDGADIVHVEYFGTDAKGKLFTVEDFKQVRMLDIATGEKKLLMEQYYVWYVTYLPDSLWYTKENKGPILEWAGVLNAEDTHDRGYMYFIDSGELKKVTWH